MRMKMLSILFMPVFLVVAIPAALSAQGTGEDAQPPAPIVVDSAAMPSDTAAADSSVAPRVIAYYFHGTRRCASCKKIEAYSEEAITTGFADLIENGELVWLPVNTDEEENQHFIDDYQLYTKSVILVDTEAVKEPRWKNLKDVWLKLGDKEDFIAYVQAEVRSFLGKE